MRRKTSKVAEVKTQDTRRRTPLAEGLNKSAGDVRVEVLDGKRFEIPMRGKYRNWAKMSDDGIVEYAKAYCKEKGITKISELQKGQNKHTLYAQLHIRKLMQRVFERKDSEEVTLDGKTFRIPLRRHGTRHWKKMPDEDIVEYAKAYCKEKNITRASELREGADKDSGVSKQLRRRKLISQVFERKEFEEITLDGRVFRISFNKQGKRDWKAMSDDEIVEYAKAYCKEKGITKTTELAIGPNKNQGLYHQLQRRKLLDSVFERKEFEEIILNGKTFRIPLNAEGKRNWNKMSDDEIVKFAIAYCRHNEIIRVSELQRGPNSDFGIVHIILDRGLTRKVFSEIEAAQQAAALAGIADALETFGQQNEKT